MINLKFKKLTPTAQTPTYGSEYSAGADLYAECDSDIYIDPHSTVMISTGIAMEIPQGYFGAIYARSGLASKESLRPANCVGVVDCDYRGEVKVPLHNDSNALRVVKAHDRIAQIIFQPYEQATWDEVEELSDTERGEGGFGHTGV